MMKKIMLMSPTGSRWVEEGEPFMFREGEYIATYENGTAVVTLDESEEVLKTGLAKKGIQFGDGIARLAKLLKIPHCSKCEQRRKVLNAAGDRLAEWIEKL